jgi:hypothetical protein
MKLLIRNKRPRTSLNTIAAMVLLFSLVLSFSGVYDTAFMTNFIAIYNFAAFGVVMLAQIMGYEGNYIDGLMSRKESIYTLLRAKYYFSCAFALIPFILTLPAIIMGKLSLLQCLAYLLISIGFINCLMFQGAVYRNKSVPLNEKLTGRQNTSTYQNIISFASFGVPLMLYFGLEPFVGATTALWILLIIGAAFVLSSHFWIKNIYTRFMTRRYRNMEGFRDTR